MNKQQFNKRVNELLLTIHRGFLPERGAGVTDEEVLSNVPPDGLSTKRYGDEDTSRLVNKPFTKRWVKINLKKNNNITALDLLQSVGFNIQE